MISDSNDETDYPHKLLLTNRQISKIQKAFNNYLNSGIKLSRAGISKMQAGGFLKFLAPLLKSGLPLLKSGIKALGYLGLNALNYVSDALIHKKIGLGNHTTLIISNYDMNDFLKIIKSLEGNGILLDGITETVKNELKEQKGGGQHFRKFIIIR